AIWGIAGPVIKNTLQFIPPFTFLFWRFLLASLIFLPFFIFVARREKETIRSLLPIVPIGFLGIPLCLSFIFLGFQRTTALDGTILAAMAPIFIVSAGVLFLKEKVTRLESIGLVIAVAGSIIMISQPLLEGGAFAQKNLVGNLLIFASNIVWTAYVICSKVEFKKHSPFVITAVSFFTGLLAIFPLALIESNLQITNYQLLITNYPVLFGILYMVILSSVVAYFAFEQGLRLIEASEATLFAYLQPIFAAPLAVFWLKESITPPFLLGAVIITLGVFLTEYRPRHLASRG
ncbi:MAG: DMT family transporter, partial [Patescibacteria group bacterium]